MKFSSKRGLKNTMTNAQEETWGERTPWESPAVPREKRHSRAARRPLQRFTSPDSVCCRCEDTQQNAHSINLCPTPPKGDYQASHCQAVFADVQVSGQMLSMHDYLFSFFIFIYFCSLSCSLFCLSLLLSGMIPVRGSSPSTQLPLGFGPLQPFSNDQKKKRKSPAESPDRVCRHRWGAAEERTHRRGSSTVSLAGKNNVV